MCSPYFTMACADFIIYGLCIVYFNVDTVQPFNCPHFNSRVHNNTRRMSTIACKSKRNETKGKHQVKWQLCFRICTNKKNHIKRNGHARKQAIALKNIKWISFGYLDLCFVFALRFQTRCDRLAIQIYTTFACDHFSKLLSN